MDHMNNLKLKTSAKESANSPTVRRKELQNLLKQVDEVLQFQSITTMNSS